MVKKVKFLFTKILNAPLAEKVMADINKFEGALEFAYIAEIGSQ